MFRKIKRFILRTLFFLLSLAISLGLIWTGFYFAKVSDEQYIFGEVVDQIFQKAGSIMFVHPDYYMGDSFQVEGTIKMNLSSEEYQNKSATDPEFFKKNQVLNNLSKMNISYKFQQDREKQQVYTEWNEILGEEDFYNEKQYINNSTQYFFVKKILNNYVNDGNNNYFESYTEEITTIDNISYLYDMIGNSIKNNVTKDYLKGYDQEIVLGNENAKVGLIAYKINDKEYKRVMKAILKDLKADPRASEIISILGYHVEELKIDTKKHYLDPKATYTINIYISKPFFQLVKYELVYLKGDQKETYAIEGDLNNGSFYYIEGTDIKYKAEYQSTSKRMNIIVYNTYDEQIGTIKEEKDKNSFMLTATLQLENENYDITYDTKYKDKKEKSYIREDKMTFKWTKDKVVQLQGDVEAISNISADPKIMVDTDSSVLRSSLSDTQNQQLETIRDQLKERLEK